MVGDLLRDFQLAAVFQVSGNAGRAEGMIANPRFDAGRFRAPADDTMGILLEEGIGCKLTGLAAGGPEEVSVVRLATCSSVYTARESGSKSCNVVTGFSIELPNIFIVSSK